MLCSGQFRSVIQREFRLQPRSRRQLRNSVLLDSLLL